MAANWQSAKVSPPGGSPVNYIRLYAWEFSTFRVRTNYFAQTTQSAVGLTVRAAAVRHAPAQAFLQQVEEMKCLCALTNPASKTGRTIRRSKDDFLTSAASSRPNSL